MDTKGWAILGVALAIVGSYFAWTMYLSPEARVERAIDRAVAAAEAVDADGFLAHFDAGYSDYLHTDRARFDERIRDAFSRVDRLNITVQALDVRVDDDGAAAKFELVVVAFRGEDRMVVVGTPFQPELVLATMKRDGSSWKFSRVERGLPEP